MGKKSVCNDISSDNESIFSKSNYLIGGKYQSSLLENQIIAISLSRVKDFYRDEKEILVSAIKAKDIRTILNKNSGSFYRELMTVSLAMKNRSFGMIDPDRHKFDFLSVIIRARYEDGVFYIYYSPYVEKYLIGLGKQFTRLSLEIMTSFKSVYSFRLYELLKSFCYSKYQIKDTNKFKVSFSLSELKLNLGIVDTDEPAVQDVLVNKDKPDYDMAVITSKNKKYDDWRNFKRCVIDVATKEINGNKKNTDEKKTDMYVEYLPISSGVGGTVCKVEFVIEIIKQRQDTSDEVEQIIDKDSFLDELRELIQEKEVKIKDLRAIAEVANYNFELIKEKYEISKKQDIDGIVGWMISAIKNDYTSPISKKKNSAWDIEKHKYDFDELEKQLLDN